MMDILLFLGGWLAIGCGIAWGIGKASDAGRTFEERKASDE